MNFMQLLGQFGLPPRHKKLAAIFILHRHDDAETQEARLRGKSHHGVEMLRVPKLRQSPSPGICRERRAPLAELEVPA